MLISRDTRGQHIQTSHEYCALQCKQPQQVALKLKTILIHFSRAFEKLRANPAHIRPFLKDVPLLSSGRAAQSEPDESPALSVSMECRIAESTGVRVLARVIQCAAKIGEDLTFTPSDTGLHIRTVNASHSACAEFTLRRAFFSSWRTASKNPPSARVPARSLLPVLRGPGNISSASLGLDAAATALVLRVTARSGVRKTFRVPVNDGDAPAPVYDKELCTSYMLTRPRFLVDVLANFHARLDEITFAPAETGLRIASFVDDAASADVHNAMLRTEMVVDAREFDVFRISTPAGTAASGMALTFYCRPFRAVLEFCEALEVPLAVWFAASGQPMVFGVEMGATPGGKTHFEADFVFATRLVQDASQAQGAGKGNGVYSSGNDTSNSRGSPGGAQGPQNVPPRSVARRKPKLPLTPAAPTPARAAASARRPPRPQTNPTEATPVQRVNSGQRRSGSADSHTGASPAVQESPAPGGTSGESVFASIGKNRGGVDTAQQIGGSDDVAMPTQYHDVMGSGGSGGQYSKADAMNDAENEEDDDEYVDGTPPPE